MRARWIPWLVAVAEPVLAAACNSITGLDDYEKVECVGGCFDAALPDATSEVTPDVVDEVPPDVVSDAADAGDAVNDQDADVVLDAEAGDAPNDVITDVSYDGSDVGPVDKPERWARWPMPHAIIPELPDGCTSPGPTPSLGYDTVADTDASTEYFVDNVTPLAWSHAAGPLPLSEAETHCGEMVIGGHEWRLPTRIELVSLLEPSETPAYASTFPNQQSGEFWTKSTAPDRAPDASVPPYWVVDFGSGVVKIVGVDVDDKRYVRCVTNP